MLYLTPEQIVSKYIGKAIVYDPGYGVQCVGGFKTVCKDEGIPVIPCPNNFAESYWTCKNKSGEIVSSVYAWQTQYFTKITNWKDFRNGDWVIWPRGCASHPMSHIAMYYNGQEFGQRQYEDNRAFCLKDTNFSDAFGALRWNGFEGCFNISAGKSEITINKREYIVYRSTGSDKVAVLSPGLNKTAKIKDFSMNAEILGIVSGANLFQSKDDVPDQPYGMTFGDISSPICNVYQSLPNQNMTLFYDIEGGLFGDTTDVEVEPTHNVFSPTLVYPNSKGHWEYARVMGLGLKDYKSMYSFLLKMPDGYAIGIAKQLSTPAEILEDFSKSDAINIAFLDGGDSAQAGFKEFGTMNYVRDTGQDVASAIVIYRDFVDWAPVTPDDPIDTNPEPDIDDTYDEETPMEEEDDDVIVGPTDSWKDPEASGKTIYDRVVALLSVKSIITIVCLGLFGYLVVNEKVSQDQFMTIFTAVVMFYFGTTFQKGSDGK